MKIIDLSYPIKEGHYRWPLMKVKWDNYQPGPHPVVSSRLTWLSVHAFTHCDSELHFFPNTRPVSDVPIDQWVGPASIINLTHIGANEPVKAADLEAAGNHVKRGDIAILRTDWPLKCEYTSPDFWINAPYTTEEACEWLIERGVKTVCYDYPPDYCIRHEIVDPARIHTIDDYTTHKCFFPHKILVIEYLANLHLINKDRFFFVGLPLYINTEGAPTRCIALEDISVEE